MPTALSLRDWRDHARGKRRLELAAGRAEHEDGLTVLLDGMRREFWIRTGDCRCVKVVYERGLVNPKTIRSTLLLAEAWEYFLASPVPASPYGFEKTRGCELSAISRLWIEHAGNAQGVDARARQTYQGLKWAFQIAVLDGQREWLLRLRARFREAWIRKIRLEQKRAKAGIAPWQFRGVKAGWQPPVEWCEWEPERILATQVEVK